MPSKPSPGSATPKAGHQSRILKAAIKCYSKFGPAKTTIEDIATEAAVGRQTIYRTFPNKQAVLDAVAFGRLQAMRTRLQQQVNRYQSFESAMIDGSIDICTAARSDRIFMGIVMASGDLGLERYLLRPSLGVREIMCSIWESFLARARKRGELRLDLSDMEIADWLRFVSYTLLLRDELSMEQQKDFIAKFVVPALAPAAAIRPAGLPQTRMSARR